MDSVKIAVLGESGVGKSALAVRMITGRFLHHYDPTLEDEYHTEVHTNGKKRSVSIMDTAGQVSRPIASNLIYYKSSGNRTAEFIYDHCAWSDLGF